MTKSYDRAAIMKDAHKRFAQGRRLGMGWTFAQCLKTAWAAARLRKEQVRQFWQPTPYRVSSRPFPVTPDVIAPHRDFIRL